jgi:hypothetical protein
VNQVKVVEKVDLSDCLDMLCGIDVGNLGMLVSCLVKELLEAILVAY